MEFRDAVEIVGTAVDGAGVAVIVVGAAVASAIALIRLVKRTKGVFELYRRLLGRAILLGLEFLVAADIIRTVAVAPTFDNVIVLALIVLIRTFLSFSLELEVSGRWPWQHAQARVDHPARDD